tara:strand:+ start:243 stop:452 length:210 start_codon:yes stop_codon:yes gene_type:complete
VETLSDEPKVEVGLREIYDAVMELKGVVNNHPDRISDHEKRIRGLEVKVWSISGLAGLVSALVAVFFSR